jgi:hypothetical protein
MSTAIRQLAEAISRLAAAQTATYNATLCPPGIKLPDPHTWGDMEWRYRERIDELLEALRWLQYQASRMEWPNVEAPPKRVALVLQEVLRPHL